MATQTNRSTKSDPTKTPDAKGAPAGKSTASKPQGQMPQVPWAMLAAFIHDADRAFDAAMGKAQTAADETRVQARLGLMELGNKWTELETDLLRQAELLKTAEMKARRTVDTVRVDAHLARLDAADGLRVLTKKLESIAARAQAVVARADAKASKGASQVVHACAELNRRFHELDFGSEVEE